MNAYQINLNETLKASQLIEKLRAIQDAHGDIAITLGTEPEMFITELVHVAKGRSASGHFGTGPHEFMDERVSIKGRHIGN